MVLLERKCHANKQFCKGECLKILDISSEVMGRDNEEKVIEILDVIQPLLTRLWMRTAISHGQKAPQKRHIQPKSLQIHQTGIAEQERVEATEAEVLGLACCCKILDQRNFMSLIQHIMNKIQEIMECQANFVLLGQLKLFKENVSIITHSYDFEKLFQGNSLIANTYQILY